MELKNFDSKLAESIVKNMLQLPTDNGLFYQRYKIDGKSDPMAWCNSDGHRQLDQDALRFVVISKFPNIKLNQKMLKESYNAFLMQIKNKFTSTDVWEQKRGYFFYSTATLIWGLTCAEKVIQESKKQHENILKELIESIDLFYDEKLKSFVKSPSEKIIDLEILLGLNVLFESGLELFNTKEKLLRVLSTLKVIEKELCVKIGKIEIPIRYKNDPWNGEYVGNNGNCRPWPMGVAIISQTYSHVVNVALKVGEYEIVVEALKNANKWFEYIKDIPNIHHFPEQIEYDGSLPKLVPKPLTWCASEIIKAERLYLDILQRIQFYSTIDMLPNLCIIEPNFNLVLN